MGDVSQSTESVAARIDADSKAKLTLAVEECDTSMSAYLESVIEDHIDQNPRKLRALASEMSANSNKSDGPQQNEPEETLIEEILGDLE